MDESLLKTIHAVATDLNDLVVTIRVSENYFTKYDKFIDLDSGLEFVVIEKPYRTIDGKWYIRVQIITEIDKLRYKCNALEDEQSYNTLQD